MKKKVIAIIQAHMSSSRLPGKVLLDVKGEPALYRMIERVRQCKTVDDIVIATSTLSCDDILVEKCKEWGVNYFRGSDTDVLERYWGAVGAYPADVYLRLTSDNILTCHTIIDRTVEFYLNNSYRYVAATACPLGTSVEIFGYGLIKEAYDNATEPYQHEHVTPYMYQVNQSMFRLPYDKTTAHYRLTMDTPEDYEAVSAIYDHLYTPGNTFDIDDILNLLRAHPEIAEINSKVKQKSLTD